MTSIHRRTVLGAGATVPVAGALAACGADDGDGGAATATPTVEQGELIGRASDVPVGSAKVYGDAKVVVTQPSEGEFKAFSAVCTHEGCVVSSSSDGDIPCRCHGSLFSATDGSVVSGPADDPLPPVQITVVGDDIRAM